MVLSACRQSPDCFSEELFCAALVTDTLGIDDHGVNQNTWAGLEEAQANKLTDRIEYIESVNARDYEKNIAYFASQGFDMIVTTVGMNQAQTESRPNLIPITFPEDQMGFVAGVIAATLTKTGVVGAICETSGIDSMWRYCEGFRAGAEFVNPELKVLVFYRDEGDSEKIFVDEAWGYDAANKAIRRGADVVFAAGGVTGQGALHAAAEANIPAIGTERDQAAVLAESGSSVVTSILGQASFEIKEVMRLLRDGNISGERLGQIENLPLNGNFSENLQDGVNFLLITLRNGVIKTNVASEKP